MNPKTEKKIQILNPGSINSYNQLPDGGHVSILHSVTADTYFKFEMSDGKGLLDVLVYRWVVDNELKCDMIERTGVGLTNTIHSFKVPYQTFRKKNSFQEHLIARIVGLRGGLQLT